MDRLDAMRVFTRIMERRSFTLTAEDLGLPRSTVTDAIKMLEERLKVKLLQRTTRTVRPTLDGEAYYQSCLNILADIEEAESAFAGTKPRGLLRIDVHGTLARHFILPVLPAFLEQYPELEIFMSEGDRLVDPVREGIDCVLRVGVLQDSDMVARRLTELDEVTLASPDYLARFGTPQSPGELARHRMVGFHSTATGRVLPLEFRVADKLETVILPTTISVSAAESYVAAARKGLGLIQIPRYHANADLAAGTLVELLPDFPPDKMPVSVLYPKSRQLSPRVRVFIDCLSVIFSMPQ